MSEINFDNTLIRCSSLSVLFTEPQAKAAKDAGELSKTAKAHLIEVYANAVWGVEKDIVTKQMKKGIHAEEDGITLLSLVDGRIYNKNDERKENEWICGHADIVEPDILVDIKLSWDAFTFLPKLIEPIDKDYYYQIQGYLWLWDLKCGKISYCLVNTPANIIEGEKYRLLRSMDVISEESPEYIRAAKKLESNMKFDQIPPNHRVISHLIERDEEVISKIPEKVKKARGFLREIQKIHSNVG